ncbi:unnamed protein product [Discula destructiva]
MFNKFAISALVAATGAAAASQCSSATFTITAAQDAAITDCTTITGDVVIGPGAGTAVDLGSVEQIEGSLIAEGLPLISLTAGKLTSISDSLTLNNLTSLSTLSLTALTSVGTISWATLPALSELVFTAGVDTASIVTIGDTHLSSLSGLSDTLTSVDTLNLNNNGRLQNLDLALTSVTDQVLLQANGQNFAVTMNDLVWAANLTIANTTSFLVPALETINGSLRFDSNYFTTFSAPNLTKAQTGDVSFINNADMTDLNLPLLSTVGGGVTIVNNTAFQNLTLPELADVGGAVTVGGNYTAISMPKIADVVGTFTVTSTADITDACTALESFAPESQGGNGNIQGKFACTSNNENANSGDASGGSSTGSSGSSNSSSAAGAMLHINSAAMGLSFVGLLAQLL